MAANILLTPETLMERASQLLANKATLDDMFAKIAQLIASLVDHWHGEAQQAFSNSFNQKRTVFDKFSQDIESLAKLMEKYANEMRELETNQKNMAVKLGA